MKTLRCGEVKRHCQDVAATLKGLPLRGLLWKGPRAVSPGPHCQGQVPHSHPLANAPEDAGRQAE